MSRPNQETDKRVADRMDTTSTEAPSPKVLYDRIAELEAQLDAMRGLRRYSVTPESDDMYRLSSVDETGWNVGTVVLNTELQAALNGEDDDK